MHVITKYKQLGKLLFVFAASRPYDTIAALRNRRPITSISSHATSKMLPICKSDVLLSPFHDAMMLRHLLHWHCGRCKGGPRFTVGAPCYQEIGAGGAPISWGPQNFMTLGRKSWLFSQRPQVYSMQFVLPANSAYGLCSFSYAKWLHT